MAFEHIKAMYDEINEQFEDETSEDNSVPLIENGHVRFGELLKKQLYLHHMSKSDLAKRMGVANSTITHWCEGHHMPPFKRIYEISHVLGVDPSYFTKGAIEFAV